MSGAGVASTGGTGRGGCDRGSGAATTRPDISNNMQASDPRNMIVSMTSGAQLFERASRPRPPGGHRRVELPAALWQTTVLRRHTHGRGRAVLVDHVRDRRADSWLRRLVGTLTAARDH